MPRPPPRYPHPQTPPSKYYTLVHILGEVWANVTVNVKYRKGCLLTYAHPRRFRHSAVSHHDNLDLFPKSSPRCLVTLTGAPVSFWIMKAVYVYSYHTDLSEQLLSITPFYACFFHPTPASRPFFPSSPILVSEQLWWYQFIWGCIGQWSLVKGLIATPLFWQVSLDFHVLLERGYWYVLNSCSASHDNWCTATLWNRIMTAQCEGMGEVGSARYEPALLPPCPSIRVLSYSNCQEIHSRQQTGLAV